ncbi:MAG: response regulator transcription factor [Sediminibacterium sp.]
MKILIADDHTIVREGVKMLLTEAYPMAEITDVANSEGVMKQVNAGKWDVIICDISMPPGDSGLETVKKIKEFSPKTPVLILSMHAPDQYALRAIKAGAMGYLNKGTATLELVQAVNQLLAGKKYLSQDVAFILADAVGQDHEAAIEHLSDREFEVFKLLASGKAVCDIAKQLVLSSNTVSTFRLRVFEKMGFKNNMELIKYAIDNSIVN